MRTISILLITFIFYSFLGWCFEMVHMGITTKEVVNRGFFNGPVIPIYGIGMMLIIYLLDGFKDNIITTTLLIVAICSILEYSTSVLMEKLFDMRWWDYEDKPLNLNGRVCFETMSLFTIMALIGIYKINPAYMEFITSLSTNMLMKLAFFFLAAFLLDAFFSLYILNRYMSKDERSIRKDKTPDIRKFTKTVIRKGL